MRTARPRSGLPGPFALTLARFFAATLALLAVGLLPRLALAAGTVNIDNRSPKEDDGRWKLKMTINYGGTPHLAHIPMVFQFTPTVHYERALTDQSGERPILNRIPLQGQTPINESMDVGFSDGSGKIFSITKFDFVVRRDRGFEAGEYDLKVTRETDGAQVGPTQKITLLGDNPIVDRRAMVFSGEKKKKKEEKTEEKADAASGSEPAAADASKSAPTSAADMPPDIPSSDGPPPVEPKQGGCGCRLASEDASPLALPFAALALGAIVGRRGARRRAGAVRSLRSSSAGPLSRPRA